MISVTTQINNWVVNLAVVNADLQGYLRPIMFSFIGLAGVLSAFFIIQGGIEYMSSAGKPAKLEHAKKILKNSLIGLVIVIAAGSLTSILSNAYHEGNASVSERLPTLKPVETSEGGGGISEVLINAIVGLFKHIITTAGRPFIDALSQFTHSTPLMAENPAVFKLWLSVLGISNVIFVLGVALLGFQVMSAASFGFEELEFRQLLPRLIGTFLMMNISIFAIDAIVSLSNAMVHAIESVNGSMTVWDSLKSVAESAGTQGFVALLIMVVFLILSLMLLVYYVLRIVTLYVGAVMAPMVALLLIIPGFKDFTMTAMKTYIVNVFVLFIHVIILTLAASLFIGIGEGSVTTPINPVMSMIIGVAVLLTLLKTQGALMQMTYVSSGPKAIRKLSSQFMNGVSYTTSRVKEYRTVPVQQLAAVPRPSAESIGKMRGMTVKGFK